MQLSNLLIVSSLVQHFLAINTIRSHLTPNYWLIRMRENLSIHLCDYSGIFKRRIIHGTILKINVGRT
ncbi:hypothetical protein ACB094_01G182900 [Castanea mollissima]